MGQEEIVNMHMFVSPMDCSAADGFCYLGGKHVCPIVQVERQRSAALHTPSGWRPKSQGKQRERGSFFSIHHVRMNSKLSRRPRVSSDLQGILAAPARGPERQRKSQICGFPSQSNETNRSKERRGGTCCRTYEKRRKRSRRAISPSTKYPPLPNRFVFDRTVIR